MALHQTVYKIADSTWWQRKGSYARTATRLCYWLATPHRMSRRLELARQRYSSGGWPAVGDLLAAPFAPPAQRRPGGSSYCHWIASYDTLSAADRSAIRRHIAAMPRRPLISVVVPAYQTPARVLRETIESVRGQVYPHWELCIADDASPSSQVTDILREQAALDSRIRWIRRETNGGIAEATNSALALATGEFVALLDHDDLLAERALYEIAAELERHPGTDLLFSDEDKVDERGRRSEPYFKPEYSYDLLLGQNLINHLAVYRRALLERVGGLDPSLDGSQDYDLALRAIEAIDPSRIRHVPFVLYHWRQESGGGSFSQRRLEACLRNARTAVRRHLDRTGHGSAKVSEAPIARIWNRVEWPVPSPAPLVTVIVPTRDRATLLRSCMDGLLQKTAYPALEIIVVDNGSVEDDALALLDTLERDERVRILRIDGEFNYSALNNVAARQARGEILLLLNNDIEVIADDWLNELVSLAVRPDIGAVGAKLLYGSGKIQHAGVRLGAGSFDSGPGIAGHIGLLRSATDPGYFGHLGLTRDVGAVTGACLAIRREIYEAVGGLDDTRLKVAFNDVDLCMKVRQHGLRVVWTPNAVLYHLESASRPSDDRPDTRDRFHRECRFMQASWRSELLNDPFYSPNFDNAAGDFTLAWPPRQRASWERWRNLR